MVVADWLNVAKPEEDYIIILDADMIMREPLDPVAMGVKPGTATVDYIGSPWLLFLPPLRSLLLSFLLPPVPSPFVFSPSLTHMSAQMHSHLRECAYDMATAQFAFPLGKGRKVAYRQVGRN